MNVVREQDRQHVPLKAGPASRSRYYQKKIEQQLAAARKRKPAPALTQSFMDQVMRQVEHNTLPEPE